MLPFRFLFIYFTSLFSAEGFRRVVKKQASRQIVLLAGYFAVSSSRSAMFVLCCLFALTLLLVGKIIEAPWVK